MKSAYWIARVIDPRLHYRAIKAWARIFLILYRTRGIRQVNWATGCACEGADRETGKTGVTLRHALRVPVPR